MKLRLLLYLSVFTIILTSCDDLPDYPANAPVTYTIGQPAEYDCYTTQNGGQKIRLKIIITSRIPHNNSMTLFAEKSILYDPATSVFPLTITDVLPVSGPYTVEVNIIGDQCSTCANGFSFPDESPYGNCPEYMVSSGPPATYLAAKPRWAAESHHGSYLAALTYNNLSRIPNVPNSCGCLVN